MDKPEYKNVLEALNSLISEKPKAGDKQAYEAAYESVQTYLEVLNLMLLVRLTTAEYNTPHICSSIMTTSMHVAEIGLGVRTDQAQSHSCSWHQRKGMLQHYFDCHTALEGTPTVMSGAMTGINMRNGRKHAAAVRLQDWIVHIATSGGCQRTHTLARVSLLLSFPESSSCIAVPNLSAVTLLGTAVTLCRDSEHIGHHTGIDLQAAYSNTDVHQALLVVFQQPERVC